MEQLLKPKVTLVFGRICSGKGSYKKDSYRVVVSDIVRSIINTASRDALQNTMHLDNRIAESIIQAANAHDNIIIDGIRQVTIVDRVLTTFPDAEMIWLEVPVEERKRRYENRKHAKDVEPFDVADNKPIELECQRIFNTFKNKLTIINNYGIN